MKNEKLVWRLSKLPTTEELRELVKDKIITQEEAREILFSTETKEDRDSDSLKSEIKFLRELVDKLSKAQPAQIIETIKYIEKPYYKYEWYSPYTHWIACATTTCDVSSGNLTMGATNNTGGSFTSINTF